MPSQLDLLIALRGSPAYGAWLRELAARVAPEPLDLTALAEHALAQLGAEFGLPAPPRTSGRGGDRRPTRAQAHD